jgi:endoglycosylceramidase
MWGTWPRRRLATATLLAVCVLLAGLIPAASAGTGSPPPLSWLSADNNLPVIRNALSQQVLLRGVNVNQLGEYYQANRSLHTVEPLTEADFAQIASLGFNVVRLIVSWSSLEPVRGKINQAYLARIHQAVGWAGKHGVYVVLDMHQDAWGKAIASPPGTTCPPGTQQAIGWDGAPAWATITNGLSTCRVQQRELAPAVAAAWQNFWLNTDGIQTELIHTWAALAASFAADPTIAGYDLLNEPNPGFVPLAGPTDLSALGSFYGAAISAIRAAERSVRGGQRHIAFFEPSITWNLAGAGLAPSPGFTADKDIAFAPHLYNGSLSVDAAEGLPSVFTVQQGFQVAEAWANQYHAALWTGEWGWFGDPAAQASSVATFAQQEDAAMAGGAWWDWKQACGDPHQVGAGGVSPSLNRYSCPSGASLGRPAAFTQILSRAYPIAVQDTLDSLTSDPVTGEMVLHGENVSSGSTEIWIPTGRWGAKPPTVTSVGEGTPTLTAVPGGWIAAVPVVTVLNRGDLRYSITVTR